MYQHHINPAHLLYKGSGYFRDVLLSWYSTLLQFLGMSENYSVSLSKRLFKSAKSDVRLALDYFRDELDNFIIKDKTEKSAKKLKLKPVLKLN